MNWRTSGTGSLGEEPSAVRLVEIFILNGPWYHTATRITLVAARRQWAALHPPTGRQDRTGMRTHYDPAMPATVPSRMLGAYGHANHQNQATVAYLDGLYFWAQPNPATRR